MLFIFKFTFSYQLLGHWKTKFLKHQSIVSQFLHSKETIVFFPKGDYFLSKACKINLIQRCLKEKCISTSGSRYYNSQFLSFSLVFSTVAAFGIPNCPYFEVNDYGKCLYIKWARGKKAWKKNFRPQNQCQTSRKEKRLQFNYQLGYIFKHI